MATAQYSIFKPMYGSNQILVTGATSNSTPVNSDAKVLRVCNTGGILAYVRVGKGPQTASPADLPILDGESIIIHKPWGDDTLAYIHQGIVATTLHVHTGDGD